QGQQLYSSCRMQLPPSRIEIADLALGLRHVQDIVQHLGIVWRQGGERRTRPKFRPGCLDRCPKALRPQSLTFEIDTSKGSSDDTPAAVLRRTDHFLGAPFDRNYKQRRLDDANNTSSEWNVIWCC